MRTAIATLAATVVVAAGAIGCSNKTEGERTLDKSERLADAGTRMTEGEQMVRDGKAQQAAGREAKRQGDDLEGDRMIADGVAKEKAGEAKIEAARRMRDGMR